MTRRSIAGKRVLVTGASSGIGRALCLELAQRGAQVLAFARRGERLQSLRGEIESGGRRLAYLAGDITSPQDRAALLAAAQESLGGLDILINNAGVGGWGPFAEADAERLRRIMEVNFFGPVELIRAALPLLREGQRPLIVNVCSVLGHRAVPKKSEYCASKFALHGFSDALRAELASDSIDVMLVSPSTTKSEFFEQAGGQDPSSLARRAMPASVVARKSIRAMEQGRHEILLPASGKLFVWLDRLAPWLADKIVARYG